MLGQLLLQMLSWSEDNTKALVRFFGTAHQRYVSVLYFYSSPVIFLDRHARITQRSFDSELNQSFKSRLFFFPKDGGKCRFMYVKNHLWQGNFFTCSE